MSTRDPKHLLGKAENAFLEFKAAEALEKPLNIGREVVGLLNAKGGDLWIGVREQDGIATSLQPIPNAIAARDALWNHLVDTIEPSPLTEEVVIEAIPTGDGGDVILLRVSEGARRPYALMKDRGRHFPIRTGARIREMSRGEIEVAFRREPTSGGPDEKAGAVKGVKAEAMAAIDRRRGAKSYWWTIIPIHPLGIDFEHMSQGDKNFCRDLLTDPSLSGNRRTGWTMVLDHASHHLGTAGVTHELGEPPVRHEIKFEPSGRMTFVAPRARLDKSGSSDGLDIFPFALIELPVSSFRMAAKFFEHFASSGPSKAIVAAVIGGMKGARLQPGSPAEPSLPWKQPEPFADEDLVVSPFEIEGKQLLDAPDAAAYRLVLRIYEQFGLEADAIPPEFSSVDRVLRLGPG